MDGDGGGVSDGGWWVGGGCSGWVEVSVLMVGRWRV